MYVSTRLAFDEQTALSHGRKVSAARDERYVVTRMREAAAVEAANTARAHDENFHRFIAKS
jgi:hypothetical protein